MAGMMLLPPKEGDCPICATVHDPKWPHNCQSLYYQMRFRMVRGRFPTWADAIAHCDDRMQEYWREELTRAKAWTEPEPGCEVIADPPTESVRMIVQEQQPSSEEQS